VRFLQLIFKNLFVKLFYFSLVKLNYFVGLKEIVLYFFEEILQFFWNARRLPYLLKFVDKMIHYENKRKLLNKMFTI
jgi:hypothetical protein